MIKHKFRFKKEVAKSKLQRLWRKQHRRKKFPRVRAFVLGERQFNQTVRDVRTKHIDTSKKEYGKKMATKSVMAMTFKTGSGFVIVTREKSPFSLKKTLTHELWHITKREVG